MRAHQLAHMLGLLELPHDVHLELEHLVLLARHLRLDLHRVVRLVVLHFVDDAAAALSDAPHRLEALADDRADDDAFLAERREHDAS